MWHVSRIWRDCFEIFYYVNEVRPSSETSVSESQSLHSVDQSPDATFEVRNRADS